MESNLYLVTGATGAVGPALVRALRSGRKPVRILARGDVPSELVDLGVETVSGEIWSREAAERAVEGTGTVFHLAAKLHIPNPTPEMRGEYERVNVEGTRVLVEAARAAGVKRLVFFSTISVYGPTGNEPVDESAPTRPDTIYAETKLRAEEIVLSARDGYIVPPGTRTTSQPPPLAGEPPALPGMTICQPPPLAGEPPALPGMGTVLRMAAIYGPRMKGNYVSLANALARGRFLPVGDGTNLRTLVYVDDAVRAAILASQSPIAAGRVYNVSDEAVHSLNEIMSAICNALGRQPPRLYVPTSVARLAAGMVDRVAALGGRPPRLAPAVDKFVESVAVRADRIQQELGFRPEYDLQKGWRATIAGKR